MSIGLVGEAFEDRSGDFAPARPPQAAEPRPPEHDPDVHEASRNRGEADVAVVDDAHPGVGRGVGRPRSRVSNMERQRRPRPERRSARDPSRAGDP